MHEKLSAAQDSALRFIAEAGGKSGGFYADFGHRATTLVALQKRGFLEVDWRAGGRFSQSQWRITPAGRALLAERKPKP